MQQRYTAFEAFGFHLPFGIAGDQYLLMTFYRSGTAKTLDPFVHMEFEVFRFAKSIYAHGTEEMPDAFARHFIRHRNISRKRRNPWSVIGTAQYSRKNIHDGAECITFMTSVFAVTAQWKQCTT